MRTPANRRNLIDAAEETFKPPVFAPNTSLRSRTVNAVRRFFDLQAGSIWNDLRIELAPVSGTLLDVGCGAQIYRPLLPAHVTYQGIDRIDAKALFGYDIPDTVYFAGDDWGIAADSLDAVLCTEVLEHVEQPAPFLQRISDGLRDGGRLILTVPFAARWHFVPHDYWRYTPSSLRRLLDEAGFADIRIVARGNPLTVACYKIMALPLGLLTGGRGGVPGLIARGFGLVLAPLVIVSAAVGTASLSQDWGEDCLGYTVTATRNRRSVSHPGA